MGEEGSLDEEDRLHVDKSPNLRLLLQGGTVFILQGYVHRPDSGM